ncbi:MAG: hypothetical protein JOZ18_03370 [Chloroflexi bacterium]|nr:hypothetical protein [Chloroflexota bacterium]
MPKFAVYYVPQADDPLYRTGSEILGYDVRTRQSVAQSSLLEEVLGPLSESWTSQSRPYGLHLTICDALDCQWTTIPQVERELADLLACFDPARPFLLERKELPTVGIWGKERRRTLVLRYEANASFRMLHTLLVARLNPLGTGTVYLRRFLTEPGNELPPHRVQQIRLFSSSTIFEHWRPHFTLLRPYTGQETEAMAARLTQLFQPYSTITVATICLLIQERDDANWQIYREFSREGI